MQRKTASVQFDLTPLADRTHYTFAKDQHIIKKSGMARQRGTEGEERRGMQETVRYEGCFSHAPKYTGKRMLQ